jgi:hypothetical protein
MEGDSGSDPQAAEQMERWSQLTTACDILESDQERSRIALMLRSLEDDRRGTTPIRSGG